MRIGGHLQHHIGKTHDAAVDVIAVVVIVAGTGATPAAVSPPLKSAITVLDPAMAFIPEVYEGEADTLEGLSGDAHAFECGR